MTWSLPRTSRGLSCGEAARCRGASTTTACKCWGARRWRAAALVELSRGSLVAATSIAEFFRQPTRRGSAPPDASLDGWRAASLRLVRARLQGLPFAVARPFTRAGAPVSCRMFATDRPGTGHPGGSFAACLLAPCPERGRSPLTMGATSKIAATAVTRPPSSSAMTPINSTKGSRLIACVIGRIRRRLNDHSLHGYSP